MDRGQQFIRRVALLDWDGTLREDFTIRAWVKFLVSHRVIPEKIISDTEEIFSSLFRGTISHDEASILTSQIYAFYLKGCKTSDIADLAWYFIEEDIRNLCSFSSALFSSLKRSSIQAIVISGAPGDILREYQRRFPIERIYALELQPLDGIFVGKVLTNYGTAEEKLHIIKQLLSSQDFEIVVAAGNSFSDQPLLDAAPANIVVNNPGLKIAAKSLHLSCDIADINKLLKFVEEVGYGP